DVVAHFTDANPLASTGDYFSAQITWSDGGTPTDGTVTWNNGTQQFDVTGTNTYDHAGAQNVSVTISGVYGTTLASTSLSTTVANGRLTVNPNAIVGAQEGIAIDPMVIAHFTDANAAATADDFSAGIHWGDGSSTMNAQIVPHNGGGFDVIAGHTYDHAG